MSGPHDDDLPATPGDLADLYTADADTWVPPRGPDGSWPDSDHLCRLVREQTDTVILGFSGGKDSLAAFLMLRRHGFRVVPFFLYPLPGLDYQQRMVTYYEQALDTRIWQYPHYNEVISLNMGTHVAPSDLGVVIAGGLGEMDETMLYALVAHDAGVVDSDPWAAVGVRAADSPIRRIVITKRGPGHWRERLFYPCWDWRKADVVAAIRESGVRLTYEYRLFGRSHDGLDSRFTIPLAREHPEDYERIRRWRQLIEADWHRRGEEPTHAHD